jgi:LmbE family N-acetylglucosaminyl deacetylase
MELLWPEEGPAHKVHAVYVCATETPNTWIDITDTIETKIASLKTYGSQVGDWDPSERIRERAGREAGRATASREDDERRTAGNPSRPAYVEAFRVMKLGQ